MIPVSRAAVLAVSALGSTFGHEGGDYLVQRDHDARRKQQRTAHGRRGLAVHCLTYAATQHVTKAALYRAAGLRVPMVAQLAGSATEGVLHAVIDDGRLLAWFANTTGKDKFVQLGAPRRVVPVVDEGDSVRPVHLVEATETGEPTLVARKNGVPIPAGPYDNPSPATGRALMDQAAHKALQIPLGAIVTTLVAAYLGRRR